MYDKELPYQHYHLEITATIDQEMKLKKALLAQGLAIDIKPFDLSEHQEVDQPNNVHTFLQSHYDSEGKVYTMPYMGT